MIYYKHIMMTQIVIIFTTGLCAAITVKSDKETYSTVGRDVEMEFRIESVTLNKIELYIKCENSTTYALIANMYFENNKAKQPRYFLDDYKNRTVLTLSSDKAHVKLKSLRSLDFNCEFKCDVYKDDFDFKVAVTELKEAEKPTIIPSGTLDKEKHYVRLGTSLFTLACHTAPNKPAAVVRWLKADFEGNFHEVISDRSEATYEIKNAKSDDAAIYKCVATNIAGTSEKRVSIFVTHLNRTENIHHIVETRGIGDAFEKECPISGNPIPEYLWKDKQWKVYESNKLLSIPNVQNSDYGNYTCSATNEWGTLEFTVTLQPNSGPLPQVTPTVNSKINASNGATSALPLTSFLMFLLSVVICIVMT